jgi:hypothetical protein
MVQIVLIIQRYRLRLRHSSLGILVRPIFGLNVVLGISWHGAAELCVAKGWRAQTLEKIVGGAILLDYDDYVFKSAVRGRGLGE